MTVQKKPRRKRSGQSFKKVTSVSNLCTSSSSCSSKSRNTKRENGKSLILKVLTQNKQPMTPKAIHSTTLIKNRLTQSTVKVYLRQLLLEKQIKQTYKRGTYEVIKTRYGVGSGIRLHNLRLQILGKVKKSSVFDHKFGDIHVYFTIGKKRGKITGSVAKRDGLLWSEWIFTRDLFLWKCSEALSRNVTADEVHILQGELGNDYYKRRISSIAKTVTLTDVDGVLERIYQKDATTVRREVKFKNTTIEDLEALWKGGLTPYNLHKTVADLKDQNEEQGKKLSRVVAIFSSMMKLERQRLNRDESLEKSLCNIEDRMLPLLETMADSIETLANKETPRNLKPEPKEPLRGKPLSDSAKRMVF